jgi:hypothetical protein
MRVDLGTGARRVGVVRELDVALAGEPIKVSIASNTETAGAAARFSSPMWSDRGLDPGLRRSRERLQ